MINTKTVIFALSFSLFLFLFSIELMQGVVTVFIFSSGTILLVIPLMAKIINPIVDSSINSKRLGFLGNRGRSVFRFLFHM